MREEKSEESGAVLDPVCGAVVASGSPLRYAIGHDEYVFCSSECRDRFADDAATYIEHQASHPSVAYVCSRDADVSSYKPGPCPKCGDPLQPVH